MLLTASGVVHHALAMRLLVIAAFSMIVSSATFAQDTPGVARADSTENHTDPNGRGTFDATAPGASGHGFTEFRIGYYDNDDSGDGNPFLDEALTVVEPVIIFDYNISDRMAAYGKLSYDAVSSASIDRLANFPEQSGASGDNYFGLDFGLRYKWDEITTIGGFLSASTEYDYNSFGLGGHVSRDLAEKNATVKFSLNGFFDSLDVIRFNGVQDGSDDRTTLTTSGSWYQVIDSRTHGEFGAVLTYQSGFLETPYNAVVVEDPADAPNPNLDNMARGTEITEELPDSRVRGAIHGKVRRHFGTGTALELGARVYSDSWGISSAALEPRVYQWLIKDQLMLRGRYRLYTQTEADDYQDHFLLTAPSERTQDSDLASFNAHTLGLKLIWYVREDLTLDIGSDIISRDDGIDQLLGSIGLRYEF